MMNDFSVINGVADETLSAIARLARGGVKLSEEYGFWGVCSGLDVNDKSEQSLKTFHKSLLYMSIIV